MQASIVAIIKADNMVDGPSYVEHLKHGYNFIGRTSTVAPILVCTLRSFLP
jgi:hypothetical protein